MRDPKPLLDGEATDFERLLLESVVAERPSARASYQMQHNLGFSGPGVWLTGSKAVLSTTVGKSTLMLLGIAMLWAGGSTLASRNSSEQSEAERPQTQSTPPRSVVPHSSSVPAQEDPAAKTGGLRAEIELLDRVRKALGQDKREEAARLLGTYRERFPGGALAQEASLLHAQVSAVP